MSGFGGMKMTIGKPGTKYGLHRPSAAKPVASVFGDADDEVCAHTEAAILHLCSIFLMFALPAC